MRKISVVGYVVFVLVLSNFGFSQKFPPPPKLPPRPTDRPFVPQELYAPYWTLEPGWHTDFEVRNNLGFKDLTITPILRTYSGVEIELDPVTLKPDEVTTIDVEKAAEKYAPNLLHTVNAYGSAVFKYTSPDEANVFVATMIHAPGKPISLHFDSDRRILPAIFDEGSYESIWWLPSDDAQDYFVLTNASTRPLQARLTLTAPGETTVTHRIAMGPRQIRKLSIRELWGKKVNPKVGGISVAFDSGAHQMRVSHFVIDEVLGTAANLKVFEHLPKPNPAVKTLRAPMITMRTPDPVLGLVASTTLSPLVVLRNTSANSLMLAPKFSWKAGIQSDTITLPSFAMAAGETRTIDLGAMQKDGTLPKQAQWGGYSVTYAGSDNDVIGLAATRDDSGAVIAQTPFTQKVSFLYKGSAWYADNLRKSLITAGNGGKEATTASLVLFYDKGQGRYELKQRLQPGEQMWLDVAYAAQNRLPDSNGNLLPSDVRSGSYELRDLDHANTGFLFEGKLTIDKTFGHATYGCMVDCCYYDPTIDPNPFYAPVNTGNQDHAWSTCMTDGWNYDLTPYTINWTTNNSSVSNFNGPYVGYVSIVGVGSSTIRGYVDIQSPNNYGTYCGYDTRSGPGGANGVCAVPTNFTTGPVTSLPDGTLNFPYSFNSSTGNPSDLAPCRVGETVFYPGSNSPYVWPLPMVSSTANPEANYANGNNTAMPDSNKPPTSYSKVDGAYVSAHFAATQRIQWECPCYNNGNWNNFLPDITIDRYIFLDGADGKWKYKITKSGYTNTAVLPNQ